MTSKWLTRELAGALALSAVLTVALFYLTFEVPAYLDGVLRQYFPEVFYSAEAIEDMLSALRPAGYSALAITVALIILGFAIRRGSLAFMGSLVLYLPTFGYFACAMFFLTGLGVLRALWLPMLELSPSILKLGCVAYLPFSATPHAPLVGAIITLIGLFVFLMGATTWLYGRFKNYEVVDFWVYRYSRHPQYLGYTLWSYGLLVFVSYKTYVRGALATPPALIWILSTMITVAVALLEELEMTKRYGEKYESYRNRTPFMVPAPKPLVKLATVPMRIAVKSPRSVGDVLIVVAIYTAILIALSCSLSMASLC